MAYVEKFLNYTNNYYKVTSSEDDRFEYEYLVPFPTEYNSTMKAYWTTDVIVLNPSCSWQTPTMARFVNSHGIIGPSWDVTLAESNLSVNILVASLGMFLLSSDEFICLLDIRISGCWVNTCAWLWQVFSSRVRQQKLGIHFSYGRFRTFCHRTEFHDIPCGPILRPDIRIPHRRRPCVSSVLSTCLYSDPSNLGYWEW